MSHTEHENEGEGLNLGWDTNPGHTKCKTRMLLSRWLLGFK